MVRSWFQLRGLPVTIPSEGRSAGVIEDFYYKLEVNTVFALRVNVGLTGYRLLIPSAIRTIERDAVTIESDMALIEESHAGAISNYPVGSTLLSRRVSSEDGRSLGSVSDLLLDTSPPVALRLAAFKLAGNGTVSADEVTDYNETGIVILDKAANLLR
jgi:uncharacterized protein YrrD